MHHYLRPLVAPESVALVGASERPGSLGRTVLEHLLAGGFKGPLHAVNVRHATVLGQRAYASLGAIGAPIDLAIIATPPGAVVDVLDSAAAAKVKVAVVMTSPAAAVGTRAARAWSHDVARAAKRNGIRIIGPGALGVIRPDVGLDATYCAPTALPGRLALIAQSGAVATAVLDFATPLGIGFSTVLSVGGAIDIGFGELLDLLLLDLATDGILLYVEEVDDARAFLSALRAAARTKPVVVLKAGRSLEPAAPIPGDVVFTAAMKRAGTVRVATYTQLFAAARILAQGRIPQGNRVAIVSNGRGPAVLAADGARDRGLGLAVFTRETATRLAALLASDAPCGNPVDVRGDASADEFASVAGLVLADANVDVLVALHVPRPTTLAVEAARSLARVGAAQSKPILGAWLGAVDRSEVHVALESGGVPNFYTPENAIDALSFLVAYRNNQSLLLEVPPPQPEPEALDLAPLEALRTTVAGEARERLTAGEARAVLAAFGIGRFAVVESLPSAQHAAHALRFPLVLERDAPDTGTARRVVRVARSLAKAWSELQQSGKRGASAGWTGRVVLYETARAATPPGIAIDIATDRRFGPVIAVRPGAAVHSLATRAAVMLPPLNARLARDLIADAIDEDAADRPEPAVLEVLIDTLTRVSAMACALPWVLRAELDVVVDAGRASVATARFHVDARRRLLRGYPHMAIHPYPVELIGDVALRDGTMLHVRPIRPEDAALERDFVNGLSEQTRYYRFFYRMAELTPAMLARFTQVDYDRELALVALAAPDASGAQAFVGVARYIANPDRTSAEFAVVVGDAWQRRGVARVLMEGLLVCAKRRGFERLTGTILRVNEPMLAFTRALGFTVADDPEDPAQVVATLVLD